MQKGISPAALSAAVNGDLDNFLVASTPGGIERQEAMGQAALVGTRDVLPIQCPRPELEKLGFVFGEPCSSDPHEIFVNVTFPDGWSKRATDHSMWSDLIDAKGRKRAGIFYKAAFYDRSAHMGLEPRYRVKADYLGADGKQNYNATTHVSHAAVDFDGTVLFAADLSADKDWDAQSLQKSRCVEFLNSNFPDWKDVTAYWD